MKPQTLFLMATSVWFMAFGIQSVVFAWLVTIYLHEPAELVGWAQTTLLLPGMLLILLAGALADRLGPDRQALYAQVFAALAPWLLIGALSLGWLDFGVMVIYGLVMGCAQAFVTPARDGLLNHVAESRVQRLVLVASLCQFGGQILGFVIAGFAETVGAQWVLAAQSAVLFVGVFAYLGIRRSGVVQHSGPPTMGVARSVIEGARTVLLSPVMRAVVVQNIAMATFFMGCFIVCFPLMVREVFEGSSSDLAWVNGFNSLGLVATILFTLRFGHVRRPGRALLLSQGLGAVVLIGCGLAESFVWFVVGVFLWGMCGGVTMPMSRTLMQELAPPAQRARVMSFYAFSFMGAGPLGTLLGGYLSGLYGAPRAIIFCGVGMISVVTVMTLISKLWGSVSDAGDEDRVRA